jgi:hypothetical protein
MLVVIGALAPELGVWGWFATAGLFAFHWVNILWIVPLTRGGIFDLPYFVSDFSD